MLRFDFTGLGKSDGHFESSTFRANVGDLIRAAAWMTDQGIGPSGIVGHSLGGTVALIAATRIGTIESVAVVNAPCSPDHILRHIGVEAQEAAVSEGRAEVMLAGRRFPISDEFLADLDAFDSEGAIPALGLPLAVLHRRTTGPSRSPKESSSSSSPNSRRSFRSSRGTTSSSRRSSETSRPGSSPTGSIGPVRAQP